MGAPGCRDFTNDRNQNNLLDDNLFLIYFDYLIFMLCSTIIHFPNNIIGKLDAHALINKNLNLKIRAF